MSGYGGYGWYVRRVVVSPTLLSYMSFYGWYVRRVVISSTLVSYIVLLCLVCSEGRDFSYVGFLKNIVFFILYDP